MARSKSKVGITFEREIINSLKSISSFVFKIPATTFASFGRPGVFDIWTVVNGVSYGIECKTVAKLCSFPFSLVKDHQIQALLDLEDNGGIGYIFLYIRGTYKKLLCIRIKDYVKIRDEQLSNNRKSIPVDILKSLDSKPRSTKIPNWELKDVIK